MAKVSPARRRRVSSSRSPRSRTSVEHLVVALGARQTGATWAKFLAAARSIAGPPMSIISTASCSPHARAAT